MCSQGRQKNEDILTPLRGYRHSPARTYSRPCEDILAVAR